MIARSLRNRSGLALTLAAAGLAGAAVFGLLAVSPNAAAATGEARLDRASGAGIEFNRNLNALQASYGLRYQCMQDFRRCTRDISVSSAWSAELAQQSFDAEYAACCYEAELCGDFLNSLGSRPVTSDYDEDVAAACAVINDAQATLPSTRELLIRRAAAKP